MSSVLYLACLFLVLAVGTSASSVPPVVVFPQHIGDTVRYHVTRTTQATDGPQAKTIDVTITRKTSTTAALSRNANGHADVTVLLIASDGSIQIPADDQADRQDADLRDVLAGLNRTIAILRNAVDDPHTGWNATLPMANARGADTPTTVPMFVTRTNGSDWDIRGAAQLTIENAQQRGAQAGFPGGGRGGGFPGGGGFPRGNRGSATGNSPITVLVRIEGHIHNAVLSRISIVETRAVTLDATPFTNTSGWIIETSSGTT